MELFLDSMIEKREDVKFKRRRRMKDIEKEEKDEGL